jgi:hypothetical protein
MDLHRDGFPLFPLEARRYMCKEQPKRETQTITMIAFKKTT